MAYNLARFNISPFNVQGGHVRWIKADGGETINSFIGSALQIFVSGIGNEKISEQTAGTPTNYLSAKGNETIAETVVEAQPTVLLHPEFRENVNYEIVLSAEITPPVNTVETVTAEINLGADIYPTVTGSETVEVDADLTTDTYFTGEGFELVSESASLDVIDRKVCLLTTTLRPGQSIIIDADTYTVLLNGVNAIEIQSGDWVDELNRDTVDIVISAAAGEANLSARLIYTERYL